MPLRKKIAACCLMVLGAAALATTADGTVNQPEEFRCLLIALPTVEAKSAEAALDEFVRRQGGDPSEWRLDGKWATTNGTGVTGNGLRTLMVREMTEGTFHFGACSRF